MSSNLKLNLRIWAEHILATAGCPRVLYRWLERGEAVEQVQKVLLNMYQLGVKEAREGVDMGALKCSIKTVISVNYNDLERFIKAETGHEYEIPCQEELDNDIDKEYRGVDGNAKGSIIGFVEDWAAFKATGKGQYLLRVILNGLCLEGKIPPGDYLVKVSW